MSFSIYFPNCTGNARCCLFVILQIHISCALNYYLSKAAAVFSMSKHDVLPPSLVQDLEFLLLTVEHLEFHIKGIKKGNTLLLGDSIITQ